MSLFDNTLCGKGPFNMRLCDRSLCNMSLCNMSLCNKSLCNISLCNISLCKNYQPPSSLSNINPPQAR